MILRPITLARLAEVEELYNKFYKDEFAIPDFKGFLNSVIVEDDNNSIVCVGGVRPVLESIIMTNKDKSLHSKLEALNKILNFHKSVATGNGFNELHAFIQNNESWIKWLQRAGFVPTKGSAFVLEIK